MLFFLGVVIPKAYTGPRQMTCERIESVGVGEPKIKTDRETLARGKYELTKEVGNGYFR